MTTVVNTYPVRGTGHVGRLALGQATMWVQQLCRRYGIWRDRQHLQELPHYLLEDIGIGRLEIDSVTEHGLAHWSHHQQPL